MKRVHICFTATRLLTILLLRTHTALHAQVIANIVQTAVAGVMGTWWYLGPPTSDTDIYAQRVDETASIHILPTATAPAHTSSSSAHSSSLNSSGSAAERSPLLHSSAATTGNSAAAAAAAATAATTTAASSERVVWSAFAQACTLSLGSIAVGSLLLTAAQCLRGILR
jgi:transglutaminase/protease-like cytokinesis protein 3